MKDSLIVLAGATGNLGRRIVRELRQRDIAVRGMVRPGTSSERLVTLRQQQVEIVEADLTVRSEVVGAEAQGVLLDAAVKAGAPRFIPSDYSMDFTKVAPGLNRNLDLHREFQARLDSAPIRSTTILSGAFMDLLTGEAPLVLSKLNRVLYWGEAPDQLLDFTTMDDTAAFTAEAAIDPSTPRILRVAGEQISASGLAKVASEVSGKGFRTVRGGSLKRLERIMKITRTLTPNSDAPFPVWQGMQYLYCMFEGSGKLTPLDNQRYPNLQWTGVRKVLQGAR